MIQIVRQIDATKNVTILAVLFGRFYRLLLQIPNDITLGVRKLLSPPLGQKERTLSFFVFIRLITCSIDSIGGTLKSDMI